MKNHINDFHPNKALRVLLAFFIPVYSTYQDPVASYRTEWPEVGEEDAGRLFVELTEQVTIIGQSNSNLKRSQEGMVVLCERVHSLILLTNKDSALELEINQASQSIDFY